MLLDISPIRLIFLFDKGLHEPHVHRTRDRQVSLKISIRHLSVFFRHRIDPFRLLRFLDRTVEMPPRFMIGHALRHQVGNPDLEPFGQVQVPLRLNIPVVPLTVHCYLESYCKVVLFL